MTRRFTMWSILGATVAALAANTGVQAGSVTAMFDDLTTGNFASIPDGYFGLTWTNIFAINSNYPAAAQSGYQNGLQSPDYVVFNGQGSKTTISSTSGLPFVPETVFLAGAWNDGLTIEFNGFLNGVLVGTDSVVVDTFSATLLQFTIGEIDELHIVSFGGVMNPNLPVIPTSPVTTQFAMDNFTFTIIPLPPAALAGLGMLGMLGVRRGLSRRRTTTAC